MGRRILNRRELRADYEAAERRKQEAAEAEETEEEEEDEEEEDEREGDDEEEASDEDELSDEADEEEDEEEAPKRKRKKASEKVKTTRSRSRAAKVVRMKAVWAVFNNSNQRVQTFEYPKRQEAVDLAAKLTTDKKSTHFVQMVKEPLEERKEEPT